MKDYEGMTAQEILNFFRNKYYTEGNNTESGLVANALNEVLPKLNLPKVGEYVNLILYDSDTGWRVVSGKVSKISTTVNGTTIYTGSKGFYPINVDKAGYDLAPNKEFPRAMADYYYGERLTKEQIEKQAEAFRMERI